MKTICIVAILADEEKFLDEWLLYHKLLGADHFFLYDDGRDRPLALFLKPHRDYVTVIPWYDTHQAMDGRNRQTKAYKHAVQNFSHEFDWITFIDGDEFIVLKEHLRLKDFLDEFHAFTSLSLNWHVFGHNGFYEDPPGLITSSLLRRKAEPSIHFKTITRPVFIKDIITAHFCYEYHGRRADANALPYTDDLYEGKTRRAHINHYQCRSFLRWMERVNRGCVTIDRPELVDEGSQWRLDRLECLKKFVTTVALDKNELIDDYMKKYELVLKKELAKISRSPSL